MLARRLGWRRCIYFVMALLAVALPGLDWVTTAFEIVPLITLFELSIWLSVLFERRWQTAAISLAGTTTPRPYVPVLVAWR